MAFIARRQFLRVAALAGATVSACATLDDAPGAHERSKGGEPEACVTPAEDLMQEHGVMQRVLLVYEEATRLIGAQRPFEPSVIARASAIVRGFIEEYHEGNEEEFIFPRLQDHHLEGELVTTLYAQHRKGRELTQAILRRANAGKVDETLAAALSSFGRLYRPHAAREDTVLFPVFRSLIGRKAYRDLGEQFEEDEHRRFGEHGLEDTVKQVAELENALGIGDLASFTPV